jgi:hypothetical protein
LAEQLTIEILNAEEFLADDDEFVALWGAGDKMLWALGEPFMITGPQGVGKSTVAQQVLLARLGLIEGTVLGLPVAQDDRPALYIAADRPRQIRRSLRRMVGSHGLDIDELAERLHFHNGPLPFSLGKESGAEALLQLAKERGYGTVVIDSFKDVVMRLSEESEAANANRALQLLVAHGIEVLVLHHQRKSQGERKPAKLDDVHGSGNLTRGFGSVALLWGEAGDRVVELVHLKPPAEIVGPLTIEHDHAAGQTSLVRGKLDDFQRLVFNTKGPIVARALARQLTEIDEDGEQREPTETEVEVVRQRLRRFKRDGYLEEVELERDRADGKAPKGYVWTDKGSRWRFDSMYPNGMTARITRRSVEDATQGDDT